MNYESETSSKVKPSLKVHEWLAILTVVGIIMVIVIVTYIEGRRVKTDPHINFKVSHDNFDVLIKGAVDFPGVYHLTSSMSMNEVLKLAGVKEEADLSRLTLDAMVKKGRTLTVPFKQMIKIQLEGRFKGESNVIILPKGSKVSDLLNVLKFDDDADLEALQKKRLLKDGETIFIPAIK